MRVSKKFFLGKQFFSPTIPYTVRMTAEEIDARMTAMAAKLDALEGAFLKSSLDQNKIGVTQSSESKKRHKTANDVKLEGGGEPAHIPEFDDVATNCFEILNNLSGASSCSSESDDSMEDYNEKLARPHARPPKKRGGHLSVCHQCARPVHAFVRPWPKIGTETWTQSNYFCFECGLI
jgi:hypothetical protein